MFELYIHPVFLLIINGLQHHAFLAGKYWSPSRPHSRQFCLFPRALGLKKDQKVLPVTKLWKKNMISSSAEPQFFVAQVVYAKKLIFGLKNLKLTNFKNIFLKKRFEKIEKKPFLWFKSEKKSFFKVFQMAIINVCTILLKLTRFSQCAYIHTKSSIFS